MNEKDKKTLALAAVGVIGSGLVIFGIKKLTEKPGDGGNGGGGGEGQPDIRVSNISVLPVAVLPGETVSVSVWAKNWGGVAGTAELYLSLGPKGQGEVIDSRYVTLEPNESVEVEFQFAAPDVLGLMRVEVSGLAAHVQIDNPQPDTYTVSGRVIDNETGQPVPGATVAIPIWEDVTDSQGNFSITVEVHPLDVYPATVGLIAACNGYEETRMNVTVSLDGLSGVEVRLNPIIPEPTELILSAVNTPKELWEGYIEDVATGEKQAWPVTHVQTPIRLKVLAGHQVVIYTQYAYEGPYPGPYLAEVPQLNGVVVWNQSAHKFEGGPAGESLVGNNEQIITGKPASFYAYLSQNGVATILSSKVVSSKSIPGKRNVGQFLIGSDISIEGNTQYAYPIGALGDIEGVMRYESVAGGARPPKWVAYGQFHRARTLPDNAYVFNGNITSISAPLGAVYGVGVSGTTHVNINSLAGNVNPFQIAVVLVTLGYNTISVIQTMNGPVSGVQVPINPNMAYIMSGSIPVVRVYANPDMNAPLPGNVLPDFNNWILVKEFPYLWAG